MAFDLVYSPNPVLQFFNLMSQPTSPSTSELPIFRFMRCIGPSAEERGTLKDAPEMREAGIYCSIMVLNSVMERAGNRTLEIHDLTMPQWLALGAVLHAGEAGISHGQLSQRMMLSKAPITGLVDRLARAGLVERKTDENDRRVSLVSITPAGQDMWKAAHETLHSSAKVDLKKCLDQEQQEQLLRLLSHLLSSFAEQDPHVAELVSGAAKESSP